MKEEKSLEQRYLDAGICGSSIPLSEDALQLHLEVMREIAISEKNAIDNGILTPYDER